MRGALCWGRAFSLEKQGGAADGLGDSQSKDPHHCRAAAAGARGGESEGSGGSGGQEERGRGRCGGGNRLLGGLRPAASGKRSRCTAAHPLTCSATAVQVEGSWRSG